MNPDDAYPPLRFLCEWSEVRVSRNRLPHWDAARVACFITFRLADSLPQDLLSAWRNDRDAWLADHPKPWTAETETEFHKRFSSRIEQALDSGHGSCLLGSRINAGFIADTIANRDGMDYLLHSWVIMPNHVHVLISPFPNTDLSKTVGAWKRFSATKIHKVNGGSGALWQKDYFDRLIRDWHHFLNVARYIRRNPVRALLPEGNVLLYEENGVRVLRFTSAPLSLPFPAFHPSCIRIWRASSLFGPNGTHGESEGCERSPAPWLEIHI